MSCAEPLKIKKMKSKTKINKWNGADYQINNAVDEMIKNLPRNAKVVSHSVSIVKTLTALHYVINIIYKEQDS